jgi:hypothetical protein
MIFGIPDFWKVLVGKVYTKRFNKNFVFKIVLFYYIDKGDYLKEVVQCMTKTVLYPIEK